MDKKTFAIGVMCVTALLLAIANLMPLPAAHADTAIKDRDWTVVTSRLTQGGDGLYVVDNRTGLMAVFAWDPAKRIIQARDVKPVVDAFQ